MGFCCVLVVGGIFNSSSKVTHCLLCLPLEGGGGWYWGARAGGREEGGARGKVRAGDGSKAGGACVGLGPDSGSNKGMVRLTWEDGANVGVGKSG